MLKHILPILLIILVLPACTNSADDMASVESDAVAQVNTQIPTVIVPTSEAVMLEPTEIPTIEAVNNAYNAPEWTSLPLVNAQTGESFSLADFAGKTVFIEPMATWCPNCRTQQGYVTQAMASLNSDDFVFISLSVGENVSDADLAQYADNNNFPQVFAVASRELTSALVEQFGFSVTSPPSTPHFTISPIGTVSSLSTGYHQAAAIIEQVTNAQNT